MLVDSCYLCSRVLLTDDIFCTPCFEFISSAPGHFRNQGALTTFSAFLYKSIFKEFILKCKKGKNPKLSRKLSGGLVNFLVKNFEYDVAGVIPIPSSQGNQKDHAFWIAQTVAEALDAPLFPHLLFPVKEGESQKLKSLQERFETRFGARGDLPSLPGVWLLIDDVITTGATLLEAHKTLGEPRAMCLTLATRPYVLID